MKLIIVDDNNEFRSNLRFFLEQKLNHQVIAEVSSGEEFLVLDEKILRDADIILMDIMMNQISGIEATRRVTWYHFNLKIIAVTMHIEKVYLEQIIEAGFKGFVLKTSIFKNLEKALNDVYYGKLYMEETLNF
jgi:DNA-binding NarL/FixJ family response regulator